MVVPVSEPLPEIILTSQANIPSVSNCNTTSAVEFLLNRTKETIETGCVDWLSNSVTGETIKLTDLEPYSKRVASALFKRGFKQGDVAIYLTSDVTRIYPIIIGVWRIGGIVYSSYPEDTQDSLLLRIQEVESRWLFCDAVSVPQVKQAVAQVDWPVEIFAFGNVEGTSSVDELFLDGGEACPEQVPNLALDEPILILCTSGTTGRSKGAVLTNKTVLKFFQTSAWFPKPKGPFMLLSRCTHATGFFFPFRNAIMGWPCVMMHQITKENIFKGVHDHKPSVAFGFPTFLLFLALDPDAKKYDFSSLESICTGGTIIPESFHNAMLTLPNVKDIINGYGLTEIGMIASGLDYRKRDGFRSYDGIPKASVGKLDGFTELKIVDLDTGLTLGPMQQGELFARSPISASGYWGRPEETAFTFVDGWVRTGDLGYYDEEGYLYIVDRIKEIFKYYANHVSPSELEARILEHPSVATVTVFGIKDPNGGDHIPRALVVLKQGEKASAEEIREFAELTLADYKKLRGGLFIVEVLPKGKTGKVSRAEAAKIIV